MVVMTRELAWKPRWASIRLTNSLAMSTLLFSSVPARTMPAPAALAVVASTHQVRSDYARLQALELQRWELQEQYTRLLLEINTWAAPHRISQIASDVLSMQAPDLSLSQVVAE